MHCYLVMLCNFTSVDVCIPRCMHQIQDLLDALQADAEQLLVAEPAECARVQSDSAAVLADVAAAHSRPAGGDVDMELHSLLVADRSASLSSWEAVSYPSTSITRAGSASADAVYVAASGAVTRTVPSKPSAFDSVRQTIIGKLREWDDSSNAASSGRHSTGAGSSMLFTPGSSPGQSAGLQPFMASSSITSPSARRQPSGSLPGRSEPSTSQER